MRGITWFLIADLGRARLFEWRRSTSKLELIFEDDRPELRDRDLRRGSDRPGRVHESHGATRHAAEPHTSNEERARERHASDLIARLQAEAAERPFHNLVLVAPPAMLGALRELMDPRLGERVIGELAKDLAGIAEHDLPEHLAEWLPS